jgi:hypothetical protein
MPLGKIQSKSQIGLAKLKLPYFLRNIPDPNIKCKL